MDRGMVGEDSAAFDLEEQRFTSWALFFSLLTGVLVLIYAVWISPVTGVADDVVRAVSSLTADSTATMVAIFFGFALAHSGLAYLRPYGM